MSERQAQWMWTLLALEFILVGVVATLVFVLIMAKLTA